MTTTTKDAWAEVSSSLSALLLKLKLHTEEEMAEEDVAAKVGFDKVRAAFAEAMDAIEDAYEDEAVRADAREAGRAFIDALDVTARDIGQRIRPPSS